jgi:hypothetical protein
VLVAQAAGLDLSVWISASWFESPLGGCPVAMPKPARLVAHTGRRHPIPSHENRAPRRASDAGRQTSEMLCLWRPSSEVWRLVKG